MLSTIVPKIVADNIEFYKQYSDNADFKEWLFDIVFNLTCNKEGKPFVGR